MEIGVEGIDKINKAIEERLNRVSGIQAKKVWMQAGLAIVREIRDNINSITGRLDSAVFAAYGKPTKPNVIVGVNIGGRGRAPHGWLVEHGHGGDTAPPHPFFKPGVLAARPVAAAIILQGMKKLAGG